MPPTTKRKPKPKAKPTAEMSTSLLIRISPDLLQRIDGRVDELKATRPGMSRSDFVREAVIRALDAGDES